VMRYVETHSRTTWRAFARALSLGNGSPAKGPVESILTGSSSSLSRSSSSITLASSAIVSLELEWPFAAARDGRADETSGKSFSSNRVMAARCEPASTARTEFLDQFVDIDLTRNPVMLSSFGPPPDA